LEAWVDFELDDERRRLRDAAHEFAERSFGARAFQHDPWSGLDRDKAKLLAANGYVGIDLPTEDGGQGGSLLDAVIVLQEVAKVDPAAGDVVQAFNFGGLRQLHRLGAQEGASRWLRSALAGELLVSVAMTEPDCGSDLSRLNTRARREAGKVVIDGQKIFTSHGLDADLLVVWCRFADGPEGIGVVAVPTDTAGFSRGPPEEYMSGERYCVMYFDDCTVDESNVLIDHNALREMMPIFNIERMGNAARCLGLAQTAFRLAVEHAHQREAFGTKLSDLQGLRWKFADMRMQLDAAQLLLLRAVTQTDANGYPTDEFSSIAKCYANESAFDVANNALQVFGGYGYTKQYPAEYIFRRVRGWMIAGGSVEVLRNRISRHALRAGRDQ
jgi:alkylation response protein AidB-like acyl-CoA dehydrogenase